MGLALSEGDPTLRVFAPDVPGTLFVLRLPGQSEPLSILQGLI